MLVGWSKDQKFLRFERLAPTHSLRRVPSYLVETYLARGEAGKRADRERRASSVARAMTREGKLVRFERSIYVPEDEICFFVFEADSGRSAALAAQRAGLDGFRVVEAETSRTKREEK